MTTPPLPFISDVQGDIERRQILRAASLLAICGATAFTSRRYIPKRLYADEVPVGRLDLMVPRQFNQWSVRADIEALMLNPDLRAEVDRSYDATLARTYVGPGNREVSLALAYVRQVSDERQIHSPENCYPAQGYSVHERSIRVVEVQGKTVSIARFEAIGGGRRELVNYWIVEGPSIASSHLQRKLNRLQLGLRGFVADGLLVRVSSSLQREVAATDIDSFISALLAAAPESFRRRLLGNLLHA